jgi:enoyl-CoA hydratase/carnithine racemase
LLSGTPTVIGKRPHDGVMVQQSIGKGGHAMGDRIRLTIQGGIADVRLNRPEKMNALDPPMFRAIAEVGACLKEDRALRAVVLSGEGKVFCAGLDVERIRAIAAGESLLPFADLTKPTHGPANFAQHVVWLWRELPVPVIAAVHGVAFGGGFQLALGADLRYAAPGTRFSVLETKWGLVPDMAGTQLMRHLAREDIVRELTYTARIFTVEQALGFGFVTRLAEDPHAAAMATARELTARSPDAIRAAKRLLNLAVSCDADTGLAAEIAEQKALIGTPNQVEAMQSNLGNRPARFVDVAG